jgi:hypothetical protein
MEENEYKTSPYQDFERICKKFKDGVIGEIEFRGGVYLISQSATGVPCSPSYADKLIKELKPN